MQSIDSEPESVNGPLDEVFAFADKMGERGVYNPTSSRLRITALKRMTSVLADNEPSDPQWVLENIDSLANRLARLGNEKPDTMRTYRSRAAGVLEDYIEYQKAPLEFMKRASEDRTPRRETPPKPKKESKEPDVESRASDGTAVAASIAPKMRTYPLGDGREVGVVIPDGGMTMEQVLRFSLHLATMSTDFDPLRPEQIQVFGLLKNRP